MATADLPRTKKTAKPQPAKRPKKRVRWFRFGCLFMLTMLVVVTSLAPTIIAKTPLRNWLLRQALELDGSVELGSASLGWFSSVAVRDLVIRDAAGDSVLEVESIDSDKPLVAMLLDVADLGRLHIVRPVLHVICQERDSNLEQAFAPLLAMRGTSSASAQLEISEGTIIVDDVPAGRQFRLEQVTLDCALADAQAGIVLAASGSLPNQQPPGSFKIDLRTAAVAGGETPLASGKIDCETNALPLELLAPLARRKIERAQLAGRLSTRLAGAWGEMAEGGETSVSGQALVTALAFSAAAMGQEQIELDRVEFPCHILQRGDAIEIKQLAVKSELGNVALTGTLKLSDFSATDKLAALAHENYRLTAQADLARIAQMLPETLQIRPGTEITSGQVKLDVASRQQPEGMEWTGRIDANHLGAKADGRDLSWENPLALQFKAEETKDGVVLDSAECTSSFLQVKAAGSLDHLTASANFDLAKLVAELRKFSDLNQVQLAGRGVAHVVWKRLPADEFSAVAEFQAHGFQWIAPQGQPWKEDNVMAKLEAGGKLRHANIERVDSANLAISSGSEQLRARLQEAVSDLKNGVWPIECSWSGQLAHWAPRLEKCAGLSGWDLAGTGTIQAVVNGSSKALDVDQALANFSQLQVRGHGWFVSEPAASLTLTGKCDLATGRVDLTEGKLSAGATVALVSHAAVAKNNGAWTLDGGTAQIEADAAQWFRWRHDPRTPATWQCAGRVTGQAQLKHEGGVTSAQMDGSIEQLRVVEINRTNTVSKKPANWQEPRITLVARGKYQHDGEQLQLERIRIASAALRCDAGGTIGIAQPGAAVDIKGTIEYDWEHLAPLWRQLVSADVQIVGQQTRTFSLHGPLDGDLASLDSWRRVTGEAAIGWLGIDLHGLQIGRGEIAAQLADGLVRTKPIDLQVSEGRLTFAPVVRLSPTPADVELSRGPLLRDVHLSPELCARGLKFMAPILADSTVADGRFSIDLDGGRFPLTDPGAGDLSGRMAMRAQVTAGPIAQELMLLINELTTILRRATLATPDQASSLLSIDDSNIEFRLVNRRVYHRNLQFSAGGLPIRTYGSVGLDDTLAIVVEVPLEAKLFGIDLSLGTLEGQSLKIPIDGTLQKPKIDRRALQQLAGQMLQNTARGVLIDGVKGQLERLLPIQP